MSDPTSEQIPRTGPHTDEFGPADGTADWSDVEARLRTGEGLCWLSVRRDHGVHTRPVFAAWSGASFVFASNPKAAKTKHMAADGHVSLAVHLGSLHLVVEGTAQRLTAPADLERASAALLDVYSWPTTVVGDQLDAPYSAPTSGGPPFQAWEVTPVKAIALPTEDQVEPTRFRF